MTPEELDDLVRVAKAHTQSAEAALARICHREQDIRRMLQEIADQFSAGLAHASGSTFSMKGLGAHQAWVDFTRRRRAALNRDLALVLAEKTECQARLRRQLGRRDALKDLHKQALAARHRKKEVRDLDTILATYAQRRLPA